MLFIKTSRKSLIPLLLAANFLISGNVIHPHDDYWDQPLKTEIIELEDGSTIELVQLDYGGQTRSPSSVTITNDTYQVSLRFSPGLMNGITISISEPDENGEYSFGFSDCQVMFNPYIDYDDVVDNGSLPPKYQVLWQDFREICGDLIISDEFKQIFGDEDSDTFDILVDHLQIIADGRCSPSASPRVLSISYRVGMDHSIGKLGRSYSFSWPDDFWIKTTNHYGDPITDIYLSGWRSPSGHSQVLYINTDTETCEIYDSSTESELEFTEEHWRPWVDQTISALDFYYRFLPYLIDLGVTEDGGELQVLLFTSLQALSTYPVVQIEIDENSEN